MHVLQQLEKTLFPKGTFFSEKMRNSGIVLNFVDIRLDHNNFSLKNFKGLLHPIFNETYKKQKCSATIIKIPVYQGYTFL